MMAQASAIRDYTAKEIGPLLAEQIKVRFLPHTVPSWAAQTNLRTLAAQFPDYTYKEAALNPTNPADRATDWESDIIAEFARNPSLTEFHQHPRQSDRADPVDLPSDPHHRQGLPVLPFDAVRRAGLDDRPVRQRQRLRLEAGRRGRPRRSSRYRCRSRWIAPAQAFKIYLLALVAVFAVTIVLLNLLLHFVIVKPIRRMSEIASEVSLGNMDAPEFAERGRDEIASLAGSFNRMRRSLANAMKLLES